MYRFLTYRAFEYIFSFSYVFLGYHVLNENDGVYFFDFVLVTTTLTFAFSNANNWLLKNEDNSVYMQFQLLVVIVIVIIMKIVNWTEYILYIPIMLLKSFSIVQLRIEQKEYIIPKYSMLFGILNIILIYLISNNTLSYSNIYFIITNAITAIFLYRKTTNKVFISKLNLKGLIDILKYLPIVGSSFISLNIDRFLIKELLSNNDLIIYAKYEVIFQGITMCLLTVLFYYHKKILVDKNICNNFKKIDKYLPKILIIFLLIVFITVGFSSIIEYININILLPLIFFKPTAILISYYTIFSQVEDKETPFSLFVILIYTFIFLLCYFNYIGLKIASASTFSLITIYLFNAKRI